VQAGFLPFEEAEELVRKEGLKSGEEWWEWCRDEHRPDNHSLHSTQDVGKGWVSWPDGFLDGTPCRIELYS